MLEVLREVYPVTIRPSTSLALQLTSREGLRREPFDNIEARR
ncbi:MAG: hypothetical protein WB689_10990 [Xanthobacteraceae bacterium]